MGMLGNLAHDGPWRFPWWTMGSKGHTGFSRTSNGPMGVLFLCVYTGPQCPIDPWRSRAMCFESSMALVVFSLHPPLQIAQMLMRILHDLGVRQSE